MSADSGLCGGFWVSASAIYLRTCSGLNISTFVAISRSLYPTCLTVWLDSPERCISFCVSAIAFSISGLSIVVTCGRSLVTEIPSASCVVRCESWLVWSRTSACHADDPGSNLGDRTNTSSKAA